MKKTLLSLAVMALGCLGAQAATINFTLNQDACTGTCGVSPFGTISIVDHGSGASAFVTVTETLSANERFAGTGAGQALEFNLALGVGTVSITSVTANFAAGVGGDSASALGSFTNFVTCSTCQGGQAGNPAGPLSFNVGSTNGVTTASFIANSKGAFFASDIVGNNGNTGNVGALGGVTATPEPSSWILLGSGLLSVVLYRSKRATNS